MNNYLVGLLLVLAASLGCTKNNGEDTGPQTFNNMPLTARIGDIITIKGTNLKQKTFIRFTHDDKRLGMFDVKLNSWDFITHTNDSIQLRVPSLVHENITVDGNIKLNLVGLIPTAYNQGDVSELQVLNDTVAYIRIGNTVLKSTNGFYNWTPVVTFTDKDISSFFFLNESEAWFGVTESSGRNVYYTSDGGKTSGFKYQISKTPSNILDGSFVAKIQFLSTDKGFIRDGNDNVMVVENNTLENVYDHYPALASLPIESVQFWDFYAVNNDLVFLTGSNLAPYLIRIDKQAVKYTQFDSWPRSPSMFGNQGYIQAGRDIFKTHDAGQTWEKFYTITGSNSFVVRFLNNNVGLGVGDKLVVGTNSGGTSWHTYLDQTQNPGYVQTPSPLSSLQAFTPNVGLLTGSGKIWKYIRE